MPIFHDVQQGSSAWLELRSGIPTASRFSDILTKSGKLSESSERYLLTLLAERLMGHPVIEHVSMWQQRGTQLESEALAFFQFTTDLPTSPVGFVTNEAKTIGASPDCLVGTDGTLEIKCPSEYQHIGFLLNAGSVVEKHRVQIQGQLWITEREHAWVLSWHPELPPALVKVQREEKFIAMLSAAVNRFSEVLEANYQVLLQYGSVSPAMRAKDPPSLTDLLKQSLIELNKQN